MAQAQSAAAVGGVSATTKPMQRAKFLFCAAAFISFLFSVTLWFTGSKQEGIFVGIWVPSILSLGALLTNGRR